MKRAILAVWRHEEGDRLTELERFVGERNAGATVRSAGLLAEIDFIDTNGLRFQPVAQV